MHIYHPDIALHSRRDGSMNRIRDVVEFGIVEDTVNACILKAADDIEPRCVNELKTDFEATNRACYFTRKGYGGIC
jgi:hypothetical protein